MKKTNVKILSAIVLVILAALTSASAQTEQQPPKFLIINGLKEDAKYVFDTKTLEELMNQPGGIGDYDVRSMAAEA